MLSECVRSDPGRFAVLESGESSLPIPNQHLNLYQVDDDGESYWVFESRDVSVLYLISAPNAK